MGRVYCSADWHGCWHVVKKIVDYLQPDDTLYFLGDFCDRGNGSSQILEWLLTDRRIKWIRGNHDQMFIDFMPRFLDINDISSLWINNGCNHTIDSFENIPKEKILKYIKEMEKLPLELRYSSPAGHTVIMEHAGYTPGIFNYRHGHRADEALWDRSHFSDFWYSYDSQYDNVYLVHGHTPVQYLRFMYGYQGKPPFTLEEAEDKQAWMSGRFEEMKNKPTIIRYCDKHKFCIDMCTVVSNRIALLDLDTFEEIYFDAEDQ